MVFEKFKDDDGIVLLLVGSFSPLTYMHLRLLEIARDHSVENVIGGLISPVGNYYRKPGLIHARHRVKMCQMAVENSNWIDVDVFESEFPGIVSTSNLLVNIEQRIGEFFHRSIKIRLVMGADMLFTFADAALWDPVDVQSIICKHGITVIERDTSCELIKEFIDEYLGECAHKIQIIRQLVQNNISSTLLRGLIGMRQSIRYLTEDSVIEYISQENLYKAASE